MTSSRDPARSPVGHRPAVAPNDVDAPFASPDPPLTTSLAWATWALFAGLAALLVGVGLHATIVGVRSELNGFDDWMIGLIGASYYGGFLLGSRLALPALSQVGHIRVFAALASLLAASMIANGLTDSAWLWVALRVASGVFIAGQYVVVESWLNQLTTNATRGRLLGVYMVVSTGFYGIGQLMTGWVDSATIAGFAVAGLFTSLAVAPLALSEDAMPPPMEASAPVSLRQLARQVPTGVGSCFLVGVTHGALIAMGAVYATKVGMDAAEAGRFVAATAVGGVLLQWPLSEASDELDRRFVGVVTAIIATGIGVWLLVDGPFGWRGLVAMALLGGVSFPLYSIAVAYTNDWVAPEHFNAAASQLILLYGAGAFVGPLVVSALMSGLGSDGYPWAMIVMHGAIAAFLVYRMIAWRAPLTKQPWSEASLATRAFYLPANAVWIGRRFRRRRRSTPQG